jgi:xylulose-5-phosphate/fructose-6-phosphate phosphoketolase
VVANVYLEGTYSEIYPAISQDEAGLTRLVRQFSFPGGIPSHVAPETPGSIHEGGELGYALAHAYGAVLDAPEALAVCVVGDGEAETGPLATSWHANKFANPATDGAVLPVLHLNGAKIAGPTVLARLPHAELDALLRGYGHAPIWVEGDEPARMHRLMAAAMDKAISGHSRDPGPRLPQGREGGTRIWPMIVLRTPKGWTGPKTFDGKKVEGTFRAHQVPIADIHEHPSGSRRSSAGCGRTAPTSCSTSGALRLELRARAFGRPPHGRLAARERRAAAGRSHASGARSLRARGRAPRHGRRRGDARPGHVPALTSSRPTARRGTSACSAWTTASNRWNAVFEETGRRWLLPIEKGDEDLAPDGRVSGDPERTPVPGLARGPSPERAARMFSCYEAFIHTSTRCSTSTRSGSRSRARFAWRPPIASLNILLSFARLAPGPQRVQPPGPGLPRSRGQQEASRSSASTCRLTRTRSCA